MRELRHAGDGLYREVAEGVDGPGVLVRLYEAQAVWGVCEEVEDELGVCFHGIDAGGEEEPVSGILIYRDIGVGENVLVEVIVHPGNVVGIYHRYMVPWYQTTLLVQLHGLVVFCDTAVGRDGAPVTCLSGCQLLHACHAMMRDVLWHAKPPHDGY